MKSYKFYWKDGTSEILYGISSMDALLSRYTRTRICLISKIEEL